MTDRWRLRCGTVLLAAVSLAPGSLPAAADHPPFSVPAYDWACDGSAPEDGFTDVAADNVHEAAIDCAVAHGLAHGTGTTTYAPTAAVTRAQLATFVARLLPTDELTAERPASDAFDDDDGNVHEPAIDRLAALGVVQGTGPRTYSPDAAVTRAQMAAYLVRAWQHHEQLRLPQARDRFADDDGSTHERAIDQAAAMGISSGVTSTTYSPATAVRRDQMARFLVNTLGCTQWWPRDGQHHDARCDSYTESDGAAALQGFDVEVATDARHYVAGQAVAVAVRACNRRSTELRQVFPQQDWFALEVLNEHDVRPEWSRPDRQWYDHRWSKTLDGQGYAERDGDPIHERLSNGRPVLAALTWYDGPQLGPEQVVVWAPGECKALEVGAWGQLTKDVWLDGNDATDYPAQWGTQPASPTYRVQPGRHLMRLSWGGVEVGQARRYLAVESDRFSLDGPRVTASFEPREYGPDEPIPITVSACNHSDQPYAEHVGRTDSSGEHDVFRLGVSGNYTYTSVPVGSVTADGEAREMLWAPGECKTWQLVWDGRFGERPRERHEQIQASVSWNPSSDERLQSTGSDSRSLDH